MTEDRCRDLEEMASRFLDGELEGDDREKFLNCLDERHDCRHLFKDYREQDRFLSRDSGLVPPPCPELPGRRFSLRALLIPAAAGALAVLFFVAGVFFGEGRGLKSIPSFARVAAPVVWTVGGGGFDGEQQYASLTGLIGHYQAEIGRELERAQPDWDRIRDLMVTLGSLRTDLELLTLHDRYQKDPSEGASSWRKTLGMTDIESDSL